MRTALPSCRRVPTVVLVVAALVAGVLCVQTVVAPVARAASYPVGGFGSIPTVLAQPKAFDDATYGATCGDDDGGAVQPLQSIDLRLTSGDRPAYSLVDVAFHCEYPAGAPVSPVLPGREEHLVPDAAFGTRSIGEAACPATTPVAVGLDTRWNRGETSPDGYTGDSLDDVRLVCGALGTDGRPYGAVTGSWAAGSVAQEGLGEDSLRCGPGEFVSGLQGWSDAQYVDPSFVYALGVRCDAPTFDPAVVAATYPQTAPSRQAGPVGDVTGSDFIPAACGGGVVATGLRVAVQDDEGGDRQLRATGVTCTPLTSPTAPTALATAAAVPAVDPPGAQADQVVDCPAGQVLTGVGGTGANVGSADVLGAVRGYCSRLLADGTVAFDGEPVGTGDAGITGGPNAGAVLCPAGQVVTGLALALTDTGYGPTPKGLQITCSALTLRVDPEATNSSWTTATEVAPNSTTTQSLTSAGAALWFKVPVQPSSTLRVDLDQLPADDDLAVFTDIGQAFLALSDTDGLTRLSAEFAAVDVAPTTFSPTTFSPTTFSPTTFSPTTFSPTTFSPTTFSPTTFSPTTFSPTTFSPTTFSPTTFSPTTFSPTTFSPTTFSPTTFSPTTFSPAVTPDQYLQQGRFTDVAALAGAFSAAQTRSLVAVSANTGLTPETWTGDTYNRSGYQYLRVTGRDGATAPQPFRLTVTTTGGPCDVPLDTFPGVATLAGTPGAGTVVVTDTGRFAGASADDLAALRAANQGLVDAAAGDGPLAAVGPVAVVDVADSRRVQRLQQQADANPGCPYAKTLVAGAIRDIVNTYRGGGVAPSYVVLEGGDAVVPFFRYADTADVAPESGFVPPVATATASDASLRNDFVLGQDAYGAAYDLTVGGSPMPVPDLAVGRLVETAREVTATLTAYVAGGGPAIDPTSTLATGYDFLTAGADDIASSFAAANAGGRNDTLITAQGVDRTLTTVDGRPSRDRTWTAADLRAALFGEKHDVVYLAGHFSAGAALAADFSSVVTTADLAAAPAGTFAHTLVFSAGCHSGYNLVDADGVPGVTEPLDWAQAFAQQGATLVAGTGYQYGDTDFVKYSNQLYVDFADALRRGRGPVAVGTALVQAKRGYLAGQATLDGIDRKSLLQATVYGMPMQGVDFPTGRTAALPADGPVTASPVTTQPGATFGLQRREFDVTPELTTRTRELTSTGGGSVTATWLEGPGGAVESPPATPTLPVVTVNATAPTGTVLRGVGFRSGTYTDTPGITPLTGAPATETNTVHGPFVSSVFSPSRLATPNYFDALAGGGAGGATRLFVTPAQYRSDAPGSVTDVQRVYGGLGFVAWYSGDTATYGSNQPAAAAAPSITGTTGTAAGRTVTFSTRVVGDPSAGVGEVWATWTVPPAAGGTGTWQSVDLRQDPSDSTLWTGRVTLPAGSRPADLRFLVQAVNGVGVVGVDDALGAYHGVATTAAPAAPAVATLRGAVPTSVVSGASLPVAATLTSSSGAALAGRTVTFTAGSSSVPAVTDAAGRARATLPVVDGPGPLTLTVGFAGERANAAVTGAARSVTVVKRTAGVAVTAVAGGSFRVKLSDRTDPSRPVGLPARTVFVVAYDASSTVLAVRPLVTDATGAATLRRDQVPADATTLVAVSGSATTPVVGGGSFDQTDPLFTAATGSLGLVPAQVVVQPGERTVVAGTAVRFDSYAVYRNNPLRVTVPATFTITAGDGSPVAGATCTGATCRATAVGVYTVTGTYLGRSGTATLTVTAARASSLAVGPPTVTVAAGAPQSWTVTTVDRFGNPVADRTADAAVALTPVSGGSTDGVSCSGVTCSATRAGTYRVSATVDGRTGTARLVVVAGPATTLRPTAGSGQTAAQGQAFAASLVATVTDRYGNPVPSVAVTFVVVPPRRGGGTAAFPGGAQQVVVRTSGAGVAAAPTLTAGSQSGPFVVTATAPGLGRVAFTLAVTD